MYSKSAIASAVLTALLAQPVFAAEEETSEDVEVIQVKGIKGSLNKALNNKRFNTQIVDSIVAEDIGKFPDNNVVEALQRVTGIQVTGRGGGEISSVSIRGLNDVHTSVNGRDVFTGVGRAVALQDIPASLLSNVTVYKTRSASQTERGIAGSINIETNRPFDFEGSKVVLAARGIYSDQPKKLDPNVSALVSNRWETDLGEIGALVNVSYLETHFRDDSITAGAAFPFFTANAPADFQPYKIMNFGTASSYWSPGLTNGLPSEAGSTLTVGDQQIPYYLARDAVFGAVGEAKRERPAASVSLQWAVNEELELLAEGFYTGYRQELQNSMWFTNTFEEDGNNGNLNIDEPILIDGTNIIKERQVYAPNGFQSGDATTGKTDSYLFAVGAKWMPSLNLTINSEVIAQKSTFETDFFAMRFDRKAYGLDVDFNNSEGVPGLHFWDNPATADLDESDMAAPANWNSGTLYDNSGKQDGDALTFKVDGEYFVDSLVEKVRFGAKIEQRGAKNYAREQSATSVMPVADMAQAIVDAGGSGDGSDFIKQVDDYMFGRADVFDSYITANGLYMIDNADAVRSVYQYEKASLTKTYDISEDSFAVYATADYRYEDISGEFGIRYVDYKQDMEFWDFAGNYETENSSQREILPSFTLTWDITEDLVGRVAYTKTLRMPEFSALSALQFWYDPLTEGVSYGTGNGGNPQLQPTTSTNYDVTLEWYFSPGSSLYGSLFKREIEGLVINGSKIVRRVGEDDVERDYILNAPVNASDGELSGVEVGLVYVPEDLPEMIDGIGFQASYTQLDSSQTTTDFNADGTVGAVVESKMSGVSDSSYSVVTFYEKENFDMRLSYVWREAFYSHNEALFFANPLQFWSKPEQSLDFQFSFDVTEDLRITVDATNILDDKYQNHYGEGNVDTFNFGTGIYSRTFAVGARYQF
ncbi:TonB-dependent receptor [Catenovulum sp. 2E275]|uniref:TonB-dependent receptor n=1 Tax=Catenovulum sp. 2E275 TaxID=2980497 RepID=UPI0021D2D9AD|nr:TonB-dependent receptor [Catenovulum sp. 2E275]MCU4676452.1 TonB-dependent receptor [Catenovulum sp. 2E275]